MRKLLIPLVLLFASLTCFGVSPAFSIFSKLPTPKQIKEYRQDAKRGIAEAQYNLGLILMDGWGVPEDDVEAVKWLRKAAEQGHAGSKTQLGVQYCDGEGVPQDFVKGYMWLNLAAAQGEKYAIEYQVAVSKFITKAQIEKAQKLSREWMADRQD
jgi:TPR repeat protein